MELFSVGWIISGRMDLSDSQRGPVIHWFSRASHLDGLTRDGMRDYYIFDVGNIVYPVFGICSANVAYRAFYATG